MASTLITLVNHTKSAKMREYSTQFFLTLNIDESDDLSRFANVIFSDFGDDVFAETRQADMFVYLTTTATGTGTSLYLSFQSSWLPDVVTELGGPARVTFEISLSFRWMGILYNVFLGNDKNEAYISRSNPKLGSISARLGSLEEVNLLPVFQEIHEDGGNTTIEFQCRLDLLVT